MGKFTHHICDILKRHKSAVDMTEDLLVPIEQDKKQTVKSESRMETCYIVEKVNSFCDCKVTCRKCQICPHMYSCNCLDAVIHTTVCKHAHFVHMQTGHTGSGESETIQENEVATDISTYQTSKTITTATTLTEAKYKLVRKLKLLQH